MAARRPGLPMERVIRDRHHQDDAVRRPTAHPRPLEYSCASRTPRPGHRCLRHRHHRVRRHGDASRDRRRARCLGARRRGADLGLRRRRRRRGAHADGTGPALLPRQTLGGLMAVFVVGNTLAALAPSYQALVGARVLTALAHGSFFGVGAVAARRLVPPGRAAQAISLMITGLTLANVIGVPLGTFVAQQWSWRLVMGGIAAIGLVTIAGLLAWMPGDAGEPADLRTELVAFRRGQVWLVLGLTMIGFAALFAVYSYVSP